MKRTTPDTFRLPLELRYRLTRIAKQQNLPKNRIAVKAVQEYLDRLENENRHLV